MELKPGVQLDHYRVLETLGRGGQATAFKAEDTRLHRPVVIKALRPELAGSETARRRFEREASLCCAIDNPHIQAVYDVGEREGLYYIVLQYVEGPTLRQLLKGRPLDVLSALSIAIQLADALAVAHAAGIVHRDLKPANVVVGAGGQVRIIDFGLAKLLGPGEGARTPARTPTDDPLTEVGVPYGSMGYSSPEQAAGAPADHRSDVFSLGVLLYEMLCGQAPFAGRHAVEVLNAVINAEPRPVRELNPRVPAGLQPILERALAKAPAQRYQTMAALRDDLKALRRRLTRGDAAEPGTPPRAAWALSGALGRVLGRLRAPGASGAAAPGAAPGGAAAARPTAPERPPSWGSEQRTTLLVLPFRNLAGDPAADFYEFALADGVITELAQVGSLVVRPSAYIAQYVGTSVDPRLAAEQQAAALVLTGGFLRGAGRLRVTLQLLQAASGSIVWSDRLDVPEADLLTVQDEIAVRLVARLKLQLSASERERIEQPFTRSAAAYEFYMRGRDALFRYLLRSHAEADLEQAVRMMHEAIGLDPDFARAHATLGRCYVLHAQGYGGAENYTLAERSLRRALELDPTIVNARLHMVYVDLHHGDKERAVAGAEALLREYPNDPSVLFVAGMLYRLDGLYEQALAAYDRLLQINPGDVVLVSFNRARVFTHQERFDEAIEAIEAGRAAEPEHPLLKTFLAVALFNRGQLDDAQALLAEVLRQNPHFDGVQPLVAWCLSARGEHEQARALITPRVEEVAAADHDIALWLASFYAMEGMADPAIEWVRRAVRLGNENYPLLAGSRKLQPLRSDPRFAALLADLEQRWQQRRRAHARAEPA